MAEGNLNVYTFGDFTLVPAEGLLLRNGEPVSLSNKAFSTLVLLVERNGHLVPKSELLETIWEDSFVEEGAITRSIWAVRNALGEDSKSGRFIRTVPRRGYRFVGSVSVSSDISGAYRLAFPPESDGTGHEFALLAAVPNSNRDSAAVDSINGSHERSIVLPAAPPVAADNLPFRSSRALVIAGSLAAVFVIVAALGYWGRVGTSASKVDSLAVLPLANLTGNEADEFIVDGMTEYLIDSLARVPALTVVGPGSSFTARDRGFDVERFSRELGVGHVLTGGVRRDGEFLRVSLRLVEGSTGRVIWTDDSVKSASDVFALEADVAQKSVQAVAGEAVNAVDLTKFGTSDREAHIAYLKGRNLWHRQTEVDVTKAISEFERAVARDPNFAHAYSGLSDSYNTLAFYFRSPNEMMPMAESYAAKALSINPDLTEALFSDASVKLWFRRDLEGASRSILRALEIQPDHALARSLYGDILISKGRIDEGLAEARRSVELDPLAHYQKCALAWQQFNGGRYMEAAATARSNVENFASCPFDRLFLGQSLYMTGRADEAMAAIEGIESVSSRWVPGVAERSFIYSATGRRQDAERVLRELQSMSASQYVDPYAFAVVSAGFGDVDAALAWLDRAVDANSYNLVYLDRDPRFLAIKKDARFAEIVRRAGLPISGSSGL